MVEHVRSLMCVPALVASLGSTVKRMSTSAMVRTLAIICATISMGPTVVSVKKGSCFKPTTRVVRESVRQYLNCFGNIICNEFPFHIPDNTPVNEFEARDMENDIESDNNLVQHVHKLEKELARDRSRTNDLQKMLDNANSMVNNLQSRLTTLVRDFWK